MALAILSQRVAVWSAKLAQICRDPFAKKWVVPSVSDGKIALPTEKRPNCQGGMIMVKVKPLRGVAANKALTALRLKSLTVLSALKSVFVAPPCVGMPAWICFLPSIIFCIHARLTVRHKLFKFSVFPWRESVNWFRFSALGAAPIPDRLINVDGAAPKFDRVLPWSGKREWRRGSLFSGHPILRKSDVLGLACATMLAPTTTIVALAYGDLNGFGGEF